MQRELTMVAEFFGARGEDVNLRKVDAWLPPELILLRVRLMMEELGELASGMHDRDMIEIADGLCDMLYVVLGTALAYGLGPILPELFAEVHRSNMTKFTGEVDPLGTVYDKYSRTIKKHGDYESPRIAEMIYEYLDTLKKIKESV